MAKWPMRALGLTYQGGSHSQEGWLSFTRKPCTYSTHVVERRAIHTMNFAGKFPRNLVKLSVIPPLCTEQLLDSTME